MVGFFVGTRVSTFRNKTIFAYHIQDIMRFATLSKLRMPLSANIIDSPVCISIPDYPHLAQINFRLAHSQQFAFDKRLGTVSPASTRFVLILDIGALKFFNPREFIMTV